MLREAAALGTPAYTLSRSAGPVEASLLGRRPPQDGSPTPATSPCARRTHAPWRLRRATPGSSRERLVELAHDRNRRQRLGRLVQDASHEEPPAFL